MASQSKDKIRKVVSYEITKNLKLHSANPINAEFDPKTLKLKEPIERPLVVLFSWLQAKQKHLKKYIELYVEQGYDVFSAEITPWQLLWPVKGAQIVAQDIVSFLHHNTQYNPLLIHGFSVGGYVCAECFVIMSREMEKYKPLLDRVVGQIWDSAADISEIPIGVPKAMFPTNPKLQIALKTYMEYHLKAFHEPATQHYIRASQMFYSTLISAPALMFCSKTDPVGAVSSNQRVRETWETKGMRVEWKCWDKSPHVMHFLKHRDEYVDCLNKFLQSINMKDLEVEAVRAKL